MKITALVLCAALAVALSSSLALAQAGQFQPPTPDELKMTTDPKAPGAAAVYLNITETADDNLGSSSFYARIKVLTEKGKDQATIEVPYGGDYKVSAIKGRTIHADGTVIPLEVRAADLTLSKSGDNRIGKKVFTLPSVEVGSILEYRYGIDYPQNWVSSPQWEVQRPLFVHRAHYEFTPFKGFLNGGLNTTGREIVDQRTGKTLNTLTWWAHLPPGTAFGPNSEGRFLFDVTNIPAIPDEDWMPPIDSVLYRVYFYYKTNGTSEEFWDEEAKTWSKEVNRFADVSGGIKSAVAAIVSPADAEIVKARKLYNAVQALENTDYTRKKTGSEMKARGLKEAKRAEDVWKQKVGASDDLALLYLSMLRAAGLNAYAIKVADRSRTVFDDQYLDRSQFRDTLVFVSIEGKEVLTDPGEKMCVFGTQNWRHTLTSGMRQMPNNMVQIAEIPEGNYLENTDTRMGELAIDAHGTVTGSLSIAMKGQEAMLWRQLALDNDDAELKKMFDRDLGEHVPLGVEAHVDNFQNIDKPDTDLVAEVKVTGTMGAGTAKRLMLPGFFLESRADEPFVKAENRQTPVDMRYGEKEIEQITYKLPAGMTVEGTLRDATQSWGALAIYSVKTKATPEQLTVTRQFERRVSQAWPGQYPFLRDFYQRVAASDQQQIVLHAAGEGTGQ